jgi:hypothetical protein
MERDRMEDLSSDGSDPGSKNRKRCCGGTYGGVCRSLESDGRFCVGTLGWSLASVGHEDVFTFNFVKKIRNILFQCRLQR